MTVAAHRSALFAAILSACLSTVAATSGSVTEDRATITPEVQRKIMAKEGIDEETLRKFLPFIYPMVEAPVGNGLILAVPECLGNRRLAQMGLVDVTAPPFLADPSGRTDVTDKLRRAIGFAKDHQMAAYFPAGTFRISGAMELIQDFTVRASGGISSAHHHATVMIGSARDPARRAEIFLAPHSPGFTDENNPRVVIHILKRAFDRGFGNFDSGESYNQLFSNIDIRIGEGNRGAIAIRMQAAEGSSIQDCTIHNEYGHTGMRGAAGSGGGHHNITVIGGRIGIDTRGFPPEYTADAAGTQPTPVMAHITLTGQSEAALIHKSRGPLICAGWNIAFASSGPPIINCRNRETTPFDSSLCMIDSIIEFQKPSSENTVLSAERSFYLENVYVRNAARLTPQKGLPVPRGEWTQIERVACAVNPERQRGYTFDESPEVPGGRNGDIVDAKEGTPPPDLLDRHIWPKGFPGWESPGAANVKDAPYGARGDGLTDDTAALQRAIDKNEIVLLPKGYYRVSDSIRLGPKTKLIGVAHQLSVIMTRSPFGRLADPSDPRPLVDTADDPSAATVISQIGIGVPWHGEASGKSDTVDCYALRWRCGGESIVRSPGIHRLSIRGPGAGTPRTEKQLTFDKPLVLITGHGGGKWYNFFIHGGGLPEAASYRHLMISNTTSPIVFYMLHAQHSAADAQIEGVAAANVTIYGVKTENNTRFGVFRDCRSVRIHGHGGIATPPPAGSHYLFEGVDNLLFSNLSDQVNLKPTTTLKDGRIIRTNVRDYFPFILRGGEEIKMAPLRRPIVFMRTVR